MATITVNTFDGLRTDCPASSVDGGHSPACNDVAFAPNLVFTREALQKMLTTPSPFPLVWGQGTTAADGTAYILVLDAKGTFSKVVNGALVAIGTTVAGAQVSAVNAYGKMFMALSDGSRGIDVPRQYDPLTGYFDRVSQDGPAQGPTLTNVSIPASVTSSLTRASGVVTAVTASAHGMNVGMQLALSGVGYSATGGSISSIVINSETLQGYAVVTMSQAHGLAPGVTAVISGVPNTAVGGGIATSTGYGESVTFVTNSAHGLSVGCTVVIANSGDAPHLADGSWEVETVVDDLTFSILVPNVDLSGTVGTGGTVSLVFPNSTSSDVTTFQIQSVPTPTTFQIPIDLDSGTWSGGSVTYLWDGTYYVQTVPSPTSLTFSQLGPDAVSAVQGMVTPQGQISPGVHLCVEMFLTRSGYWTAPSPPVSFTADGSGFVQASSLTIGPPNIVARGLAFTGTSGAFQATGGLFFMLAVPAQSGGYPISTSTVINDNTTTSVLLDFSDQSLLSAQGISVPGNNRFAQVTLEPSLGVTWFGQRMTWWGQRNTIGSLVNLGFEGGVLFGAPNASLGWTIEGTGGTLVPGNSGLAWQISGGTGQISQTAYQDSNGVAILQSNTLYSFRFWAEGNASTGTITANLFSASGGGVLATATLSAASADSPQFYEVAFSAKTPEVIPTDSRLQVLVAGLTGTVTLDELSLGYAENPYRNPIARMSYVRNPEAFDGDTGVIGPGDDTSALIAVMRSSESTALFVTEQAAYYTTQIEDAEPSSWQLPRIGQDCGLSAVNAIVRGKGWIMWGGKDAAQLYTGGVPLSVSNNILPSWQAFTAQWASHDATLQRVYFGGNTGTAQTLWMYDYHAGIESGAWSNWTVPSTFGDFAKVGTFFTAGTNLYTLSSTTEAKLGQGPDADDDFGTIASSYIPGCFADSGTRKMFTYMITRVSGDGTLAVQQFRDGLNGATKSTRAFTLVNAPDTDVEMTLNISARYLFLKFAPVGRFAMSEINVICTTDIMSSVTGWF